MHCSDNVIPPTPSITNIGEATTKAEGLLRWKREGESFSVSKDLEWNYEWATPSYRNCGISSQGLIAIDGCKIDLVQPKQVNFKPTPSSGGARNSQYVYAGMPTAILAALKEKVLKHTGIEVGDNQSLSNVVVQDGMKYWNLTMEQAKSPIKFIKETSPGHYSPSPPSMAAYCDAYTIANAVPGCYHATLFCSVKIVTTYVAPPAAMVRTLPSPASHHFTFTLKAARLTGKAPDKVKVYSSALDA
jgi:hypothetical protein